MIKILFGKFLLTCDHTDGCSVYISFKNPDDASAILKEKRWLSFTITPTGVPDTLSVADQKDVTKGKLVFLCNKCQAKIPIMTRAQYLKMRENAHSIS